jgi:hypothetical protein
MVIHKVSNQPRFVLASMVASYEGNHCHSADDVMILANRAARFWRRGYCYHQSLLLIATLRSFGTIDHHWYENDTVLTPFSAFMLHPMNISSFISLLFILIYRDVIWCCWFAPYLCGNENVLMVLPRASQHDCSSFVVLGRFILYQYNFLWPVSHQFD